MTEELQVVRLDASRIDEAADVLTRAFFDYPIWPWMIPDDAARRDVMPWFMRMSLRWAAYGAETYATAPDLRGIAMWETLPEREIDHGDAELEAMWESLPERMGAHGIARFRAMIETQRPIRERISAEGPVWYLPWLGVDPDAQRSGVGGALLRDMFARADASGAPCLLETEKEANVPYYERHGFRVIHAGTLPLDGPGFWTMVRRASRFAINLTAVMTRSCHSAPAAEHGRRHRRGRILQQARRNLDGGRNVEYEAT